MFAPVTTIETQPLPAPRLQLRWEKPSKDLAAEFMAFKPTWACHYELVLPLRQGDVRGEADNGKGDYVHTHDELVVPIKSPSGRGGEGREPCKANWSPTGYYDDTPYRDGVHALWDAKVLGDPPIFVIAPDGTALRVRGAAEDN
jgi:hypothetical protein